MLDGKFEALPPNAWQPFGFGLRGCIGRPFAWQEAQMALICIFQRFDLVMRDPTYELELKQTLTIKPHNFYIHAIPRKDRPRLLTIAGSAPTSSAKGEVTAGTAVATEGMKPLYVLYGSNTGTSESFAQRIVSAAPTHGEPQSPSCSLNESLNISVRLPGDNGDPRYGDGTRTQGRTGADHHGIVRGPARGQRKALCGVAREHAWRGGVRGRHVRGVRVRES